MKVIKYIRLKNKWTQEYVANLIGITKASYSNIETGKRNPSLSIALKIQNIFNESIEILLQDNGEP